MDESTYIKERLQEQIDWYSDKSTWNKRWYIGLKVCEFIASASIPLMVGFLDGPFWLRLLIGLCGVIVTVIGSVHGLMKFHENWLEYRSTSEILKHELNLYQTHTGPYKNEDDSFTVLVERCEEIISHENLNWKLTCSDEEETSPKAK